MKQSIKNRKDKKRGRILWIVTMILVLIITGCSNGSTTNMESTSVSTPTSAESQTTNENYVSIILGDEIIINGDQEGITVTDQTINITKGGFYSISGTLENGQILLEAHDETFTLELNGVNITNNSGPAILTLDAEHTYILLAEHTVNTLADGGQDEDHEAPLFSCDDMTVSGEGTLNLIGNYQEGIESNDILTINGGIINIEAPDDALNAGDAIVINGGHITADCGGDGIDSNGDLTINGGNITVSAGNNGNGPVDIGDGSYKLIVNGGVIVAAGGNMGVNADSSSTQNVIWIYDTFSENEVVTLTDESGTVILETTLPKAASAIFISTNLIETGQTYNLLSNNQTTQTFTVSELSTTIGESKGMGGTGGRPGRQEGQMKPPEGDMAPLEGDMAPPKEAPVENQ